MTSRPPGLVFCALLGCVTPAPSSPAEAYATALDEGRVEEAYGLTTPAFRAQVSAEQFQSRFADSAARQARAAAVRDGLAELERAAPELFGRNPIEGAEDVIFRFAAAVHAGRFDEARQCLCASLRARYSAELLSQDFHSEPTARARLERAVLAAEGLAIHEGSRVRFPLAGGGSVVVLRENSTWKLEALE